MTMNPKISEHVTPNGQEFRLAVFSDIHLGHHRVLTEFILGNLSKFLHDPEFIETLDMIVLAGDVFDRLIFLNQVFIPEIDLFFMKFFELCKKYNVSVKILEGTRSHDRNQAKRLIELNERIGKIYADVVYIDQLSIVYDEKWNFHYLFVPDEWHHDTSVTLAQVHELLKARKLDKVDFAFMHGNFKYQLPAIVKAPMHDEESYLSIVRYAIFIGHIHNRSKFKWIYAQGSFDCLSHGETYPKGFYRFNLKGDGKHKATFVVNEGAKQFLTIDCRTLDVEASLEKIDREVKNLPEDSHVQLFVNSDSPLAQGNICQTRYPLLNWKTKREESIKVGTIHELKRDLDYVPMYITAESVFPLVRERVERQGLSEELINAIDAELQDIVKERVDAL